VQERLFGRHARRTLAIDVVKTALKAGWRGHPMSIQPIGNADDMCAKQRRIGPMPMSGPRDAALNDETGINANVNAAFNALLTNIC
jgi:hypothetical protein